MPTCFGGVLRPCAARQTGQFHGHQVTCHDLSAPCAGGEGGGSAGADSAHTRCAAVKAGACPPHATTSDSSEAVPHAPVHHMGWPCRRIGGDGQTVSLNVPKDETAGLVNNQQENFSFKVSPAPVCLYPFAVRVLASLAGGGGGRWWCVHARGKCRAKSPAACMHACPRMHGACRQACSVHIKTQRGAPVPAGGCS